MNTYEIEMEAEVYEVFNGKNEYTDTEIEDAVVVAKTAKEAVAKFIRKKFKPHHFKDDDTDSERYGKVRYFIYKNFDVRSLKRTVTNLI